jgi:hypothetical protein
VISTLVPLVQIVAGEAGGDVMGCSEDATRWDDGVRSMVSNLNRRTPIKSEIPWRFALRLNFNRTLGVHLLFTAHFEQSVRSSVVGKPVLRTSDIGYGTSFKVTSRRMAFGASDPH